MSSRRVRVRALPVAVCVALAVSGCAADPLGSSGCDSRIENQVKGTASFRACSALTGLELGERLKKKDDLDPTRVKFCGSQACLDVFRQLQSLGGLYCLAPYSTATLALNQAAGGVACFGAAAFAPPTLAPTEPPTAPPTSPPTEPAQTVAPETEIPAPGGSMSGSSGNSSSSSGNNSSSSDDDDVSPTIPVATPVKNIVRDQTTPASNVSIHDEASRNSNTHSVILWLLVVTSSFMAVVFALACIVFYRRATRSTSDDESGYVKQAKTTREQRTASTTGDLATECESPINTAPPSDNSHASSSVTLDSIDCNDEAIMSCRVPYEKVVFGERISQGSFGEVYRGSYRGDTVAIKTLLPVHRKSTQHIQNFLQEVKLLAALDHERIVQFIGVAWDSWNELSVVMEFVERGDLRTLLKEYEASGLHAPGFDATKVKIALHVAHGLMYLHTLQSVVLHRDLKSRNVLLDADLNAKITDFGVSREQSDCTMTAGVGSGLWMAPEVMMGERYDEKADIFSFGVLLSEIDLHCVPYSHARASATDGRRLPDTTIIQMVSMGILTVAFSDEERSAVAQLGRDCVSLDPAERPRAGEVLHRLHQIHQDIAGSRQERQGAFV